MWPKIIWPQPFQSHFMKCVNLKTGKLLADNLDMKDSFLGRLIGLMGKKNLKKGQGIILKPCSQIHTCFMRFTIDAVFCDKTGNVLYVKENMKPWRWGRFVRGSRYTLELPGGCLAGRVKVGDELVFADHFN